MDVLFKIVIVNIDETIAWAAWALARVNGASINVYIYRNILLCIYYLLFIIYKFFVLYFCYLVFFINMFTLIYTRCGALFM